MSSLSSFKHALTRPLHISPRRLWLIYGLAGLSFVPHLFLQYVGEEGVYAIVAQEMARSRDFIVTTLYGAPYGRPGLLAWLTLPLMSLVGWEHVLVATRLLAAGATVLTGVMLAWFVRRLFKDATLAAFAALVYLSGDTLIYRGWLAYSDPAFALFIFAAMACLWIAVEERRNGFLLLAALAVVAAALTKTLTVHAFYGVLGLVLVWRHGHRRFLFNPVSLAVHAALLAFPFVWDWLFPGNPMIGLFGAQSSFELFKSVGEGLPRHIVRMLLFPADLLWRLLPVSAVALYCVMRRGERQDAFANRHVQIAAWAVLINMLPYWLIAMPPRHLMPLVPFLALLLASIVYPAGETIRQVTLKALIATIGIAYGAALVGFPLYERHARGDYRQMARQIVDHAGAAPIYSTDTTALGLSLVANINTLRGPVAPVTVPRAAPGFVLTELANAARGPLVMTIRSGSRTRYLHCHPALCPQK